MILDCSSEQAFALLERAGRMIGEVRIRESNVRAAAGVVLHGLGSDGQRHLLVPLLLGDSVLEDIGSVGVQIVERTLIDGDAEKRFLDVVCQLPHLRDLFSVVTDEMLVEIAEQPDQPSLCCRRVLERWRELLERPRARILGPEQLAGLLGELRFLERVAEQRPNAALGLWVGPRGERFDFRNGPNAVEIKATLGREGRWVEIHGDRQLDRPEGGTLHLVFARFERVPHGGESVPDMVERLLSIGIQRQALLTALLDSGYDPSDTELYRTVRFHLDEELLYAVTEEFPRIVPSSFKGGTTPERVTHLRYRIDLDGQPPTPLGADGYGQVLDLLLSSEAIH